MIFNKWINQARESWRENNPMLFEELSRSGMLEKALLNAAKRTHTEMSALEASGFSNHEAWEMTRENYLFLRPEEAEDVDGDENLGAKLFSDVIALQSRILRSNSEIVIDSEVKVGNE